MKRFICISLSLLLLACSNGNNINSGNNPLIVNNMGINNNKVFFDFDSAHITNISEKELEHQSLYLKKNPRVRIVLEGHCDERGSTEYNLALGALRAGNAAHILFKNGIEPKRIKTISYGKNRPQYFGTGERIWALNRNVTTKVKAK